MPGKNDTGEVANEKNQNEKEFHLRQQKFEFERYKWEKEFEQRQAELKKKTKPLISPFIVTIIIALIGVIGTATAALVQGYANIELERQKFNSELILKALDTGNKQDAADFLRFLQETNLIKGIDDIALEPYFTDPAKIPLRPVSSIPERDGTVPEKVLNPGIIRKIPSEEEGVSKAGRTALMVALKGLGAGASELMGRNDGSRVKEYTQGNPGLPGCMFFVSWCFSQTEGDMPFSYTDYTGSFLREMENKGWYHSTGSGYEPVPGDILVGSGTPSDASSAAIIYKLEDGILYYIKCSTNDMVMMTDCSLSEIHNSRGFGFVHIPDQ